MFSKYIGIPFENRCDSFESCDCFGLVRILYATELGLEIFKPKASAFNGKDVETEYLHETSRNWTEVKELELYDVIAMANDGNHPNIIQHFGIYIGNNKMIHTLNKVGSHVVNINQYKSVTKGYFRYG